MAKWMHEQSLKRKLIAFYRLMLRLLVRGFISLFTLLEYRTKSFEDNKWEDEASLERTKTEPVHR
jgi:hypothetical protein